MKAFYQLYNDTLLQESLLYSFGFNGYISNINGLQKNISHKRLSLCHFTKHKTSFKKAYYPPETKKTVHNSYHLNQHILLTGPNASGKTTLLKTTICNIILSQQCGLGFYKKAKISPYNKIYCYINIPDTSGRDSLFQAEARRCKEILDCINDSATSDRHFCVFDELYSGTNPYEATGGAISFLKYLNKNPTVKFFITTHYLELCKRLDTIDTIKNYHMKTIVSHENNKDTFTYAYQLKNNISDIQGGVKVLCDLGYPDEIIHGTKKIMADLSI
jgi:DNA mismatch repair ATPase MutS